MSEINAYLVAAREQITLAEKKRETYQGSCSDCRFCRKAGLFRLEAACTNPFVKLTAFNLTDEYAKGRVQRCGYQRDKSGVWGPIVCGPDGALFEPR